MEINQLNFIDSKSAHLKLEEFILVEKNIQKISEFKAYVEMWKVAFSLGKLELSRQYCLKAFFYLLHFKRIPKIKEFIKELDKFENDSFIKNSWAVHEKILLGKKNSEIFFSNDNFEIMHSHPEHWKFSLEFLKEYLTIEIEWGIDDWKLCYEYILLNRFDKDIFKLMYYHFEELGKDQFCSLIKDLFKKYKISHVFKSFPRPVVISKNNKIENKLQLEIYNKPLKISDEETNLITSIKILSDDELIQNGLDLLLALKFLNMNYAVDFLSNKLLFLNFSAEKKLEIYNFKIESLFAMDKLIEVIDQCDYVISNELFIEFSLVNFEYLKAETYLKLKDFKKSKGLFLKIKNNHSNFRMTLERLNEIEKNK